MAGGDWFEWSGDGRGWGAGMEKEGRRRWMEIAELRVMQIVERKGSGKRTRVRESIEWGTGDITTSVEGWRGK